MATETEIAWAAGLFEGEGSINWSTGSGTLPERHRPQARLVIGMTDRDVLERFARVVGHGTVRPKAKHRSWQPHFKDAWVWEVRTWETVTAVLNMLLPWLGERRSARAHEIFERGHAAREVACATCGDIFTPGRGDARYCSGRCKNRARAVREGRPPLWRARSCSCCGREYVGGGQHKVGYCSARCRYVAHRRRHGLPVPSAEGVI